MEKKGISCMNRCGGDVDLHAYSELFKESINKYWKARGEREAFHFRYSISDKLYRKKLKAVETLRARLEDLTDAFAPNCVVLFLFLCWTTKKKKVAESDECPDPQQLLISSYRSTAKFFHEQSIYALLDLGVTQLKNIEAYNSETLAILKAEDLDEETLHEMSNHYSNFYKGLRSLDLKICILRFHLMRHRPNLETLVDRFSTSVEGELRQYEKQLNTTRFRVFRLAKTKKTKHLGLRWLPASCKGPVLSTGMKTLVFCVKLWELVRSSGSKTD